MTGSCKMSLISESDQFAIIPVTMGPAGGDHCFGAFRSGWGDWVGYGADSSGQNPGSSIQLWNDNHFEFLVSWR